MSVRPLPDKSISPISACVLNDSARLNFCLPFAAAGFSFFSASWGADVFSFTFLIFESSCFVYTALSSASLFCVSAFLEVIVFITGFFCDLLAEFSRDPTFFCAPAASPT